MTDELKHKLLRYLGYPAFFVLALVLMLYLTFPYDRVAELAKGQAKEANYELSFGSLGPGLSGITARRVTLTSASPAAAPAGADGAPVEEKALKIERISVRPSLFPLGVAFSAELFDGEASGAMGVTGKLKTVELKLRELKLDKANLKGAVGLNLGGTVNGSAKLKLDPQDFSKTSGKLALSSEGLALNGGTVANYDLPKVDLGQLDAEVQIDQGKAEIKTFKASGPDAEAKLEGEIGLGQRLPFSTMKIKVALKPNDEWMKKNSIIQAGLNFAMGRDSSGFYNGNIAGMLGNPRFSR